jgi:hypothetical protein
MPRAQLIPRRVVPWYKTNAFRATLIVVLVVIAAVVTSAVAANRAEERSRRARADEIGAFVADVRGLLQDVGEAGRGLDGAPTAGAEVGDARLAQLREDAGTWTEAFRQAVNDAAGILPPAGLENASDLFLQSLGLYESAADLYRNAARAEGGLRDDLLTQAAAVRDRAAAVWRGATTLVDAELSEVDEPPSGLGAPTQGGGGAPAPELVPPGGQGQGDGRGDGQGDGSGGGSGG